MVQQKLLGTPVDLVGRAVVVPNPDLSMDEVGLPEARAWAVYSPFIVHRLVRKGVGRLEAVQAVKNRSDLARGAMLDEMKERPVLVNRAPVLHRYGLMAFWPKLVKGDVLHISPPVVSGFGMDFDGDASNYHVPATDEARDEAAAKMLPSKNLFSTHTFRVHYLPRLEYMGGLYSATAPPADKRPRVFRNRHDAIQAFRRGELDLNHPIQILET
jgi:DNA-directed RNA polymerase subunit beta'